jgi:hypothetical protein
MLRARVEVNVAKEASALDEHIGKVGRLAAIHVAQVIRKVVLCIRHDEWK